MTAAAHPAPTATAAAPAATNVPSTALAGAVMASIVVIWGLGPPVTKLISAPPLVGASLRFWLAVPLILGTTYATGRRLSRATLRATALPGALFGLNLLCVFATLQHADHIVREELRKAGLEREIWQSFAVLPDIRSVGVMGDERTYDHVCALRAVTSVDGMTADFYPFDMKFIGRVATRIINEVKGINRVVYDVTSKPPGTIEWE